MVSAQFWGKNTAFCVYSVHVKYWCLANLNLAYFIESTTAVECQKQLLMSNISNLGGRESLETAVIFSYVGGRSFLTGCSLTDRESVVGCNVLTKKTVKNSPFS